MTVVPAVVYLVTLVVRYEHSHGLGCGASCVRAGNGNGVNAPGAVPIPLGTELHMVRIYDDPFVGTRLVAGHTQRARRGAVGGFGIVDGDVHEFLVWRP